MDEIGSIVEGVWIFPREKLKLDTDTFAYPTPLYSLFIHYYLSSYI
jgi:hypothetical protein